MISISPQRDNARGTWPLSVLLSLLVGCAGEPPAEEPTDVPPEAPRDAPGTSPDARVAAAAPAPTPPPDWIQGTLRADTVATFPPVAIGERRLLLDGGDGGVHFLTGGDGVRAAGAGDPARGLDSRVTPLVISNHDLGYVWRAPPDAREGTLVLGAEHGPPADAPEHPVVYLTARDLPTGGERVVTLDETRPYALLGVPEGALTLARAGSVRASALLVTEREADTWLRVDESRLLRGTARLLVPGEHAVALLLRREGGSGQVTIRHAPFTSERPRRAARSAWRIAGSDDGETDSHWGAIASPDHVLAKRISLDASPSELEAARIVYRMGSEPWHPAVRKLAPAEAPWSDLVVELNGREVFRGSVDVAAREGWHTVDVEPSALRRGENEIRFRVAGPDYVYLALDTDTDVDRSGVVEDGRMNPRTVRPGRSLDGEYLVRLEVR